MDEGTGGVLKGMEIGGKPDIAYQTETEKKNGRLRADEGGDGVEATKERSWQEKPRIGCNVGMPVVLVTATRCSERI